MPRSSCAVAAALALLAVTGVTTGARAYCLTSACEGDVPGQLCTPASKKDCGTPLFWSPACFGVAVQRDGSSQVDLQTAQNLVRAAFDAWETADCGAGAHPGIHVELFDAVSCDQQEYNQQGGNVNVVVFRDDVWPYVGAGRTLALTTVTYNLDTGEIFDADLEVNSTSDNVLTVGDTNVQYDLLSVLTHEAGHMLGMAHSADPTATMQTEYQPGDLELRTLAADDVAGICASYPPPDLGTCDTTPRHGFKDTCGPGPTQDEGCTLSARDDGDASWLAMTLFALLATRLRRPGRPRKSGRS